MMCLWEQTGMLGSERCAKEVVGKLSQLESLSAYYRYDRSVLDDNLGEMYCMRITAERCET